MDKTKKEGNMKKLKILAVVLALGALCMGMLSGCDNGKDGLETLIIIMAAGCTTRKS